MHAGTSPLRIPTHLWLRRYYPIFRQFRNKYIPENNAHPLGSRLPQSLAGKRRRGDARELNPMHGSPKADLGAEPDCRRAEISTRHVGHSGSRHCSSDTMIFQRLITTVVFMGFLIYSFVTIGADRSSGPLILSHAEYLDRVEAIWTAQMIAQSTGLRFEHQPASVLPVTPMTHLPGYAPVDDDYYYEMVAIRAFEKYGIGLTVEQLGEQWLENNAG